MRSFLLLLFLWTIFTFGCKKDSEKTRTAIDLWDIDKDGLPQFTETNYIELPKIHRISIFRSSFGHDYSDAFEHCRSMKHYVEPKAGVDWSTKKNFAPVTGKVTRLESVWAGTKTNCWK